MDIANLSLRELVAHQQRGVLSSEAIVRHYLARAAALEPAIKAFAWLDAPAALAEARAADRRLAAAGRAGPLHGIPLGIKDIIATRGIPTRMGSPLFADNVPSESAAVVHGIEQAGGYVFGKTVTAELAYFHPGPTRNPWNLAHTPGGSSMGSAAAVAAGMVPAALGTQTNGSVIRPAAFCGCVGFKPSAGLIATAGIQPFAPTLDQVGVFARRIEDAARVAAALIAPGEASASALAQPPAARPPPRLALVRSPVWERAEPAQRALLAHAAERLRAAGALVEERELPPAFAAAQAVHRTIMYAEGARTFAALTAGPRAQLSAELNQLIDAGAAISEPDYRQALAQRAQLQQELAHWFARCDALITPPACGEAPAQLEHTGDPAFCTLWTLCGVPAVSVPAGVGPHGLPLGLQVVGRYRADARTAALAQWCAAALGEAVAPLAPVLPSR